MDLTTRALVAANVLALRQRAGLTQGQLARRAGIGQTTVSSVEDPEGKSPTIETLEPIAQGLGVPLWLLFLPTLPSERDIAKGLDALARTYLSADPAGRRLLDSVAEAEARYTSKR